jgi:methionyl aminopeptidase
MKLKNVPSEFGSQNAFVKLKDSSWLERLRVAGKCVSSTMIKLEVLVKEKTNLSLVELSDFAESEIRKQDCEPTFKGYKGFPAAVCISVNKQLVHGVPTDYKLQDGDLVSFDFGATYKGAIADSATTCIFGEAKHKEHIALIKATKESLAEGIKAVAVGNRIGAIGHAVYNCARERGFRVIENYGGHGIDENTPHAQPFVSNKSEPNKGVRMQPGLTIAIEPMLIPYRTQPRTKTGSDGWTVYTEDIGAHEEHTIFVHEDGIEIITER